MNRQMSNKEVELSHGWNSMAVIEHLLTRTVSWRFHSPQLTTPPLLGAALRSWSPLCLQAGSAWEFATPKGRP